MIYLVRVIILNLVELSLSVLHDLSTNFEQNQFVIYILKTINNL